MKDKSENNGKYNNDDERLSRDLKKHNWLINKLKERLDVPDPLPSEKSSAATEEKETKKPQRVGGRRHSIAITPAKCKGVRSSETERSQESQKESDIYPGCEIIDYSLKRATKYNYLHKKNLDQKSPPDSFIYEDVIYDLRKKKDDCKNYDQMSNSQSQNVIHISNDVVYDLSKNKQPQSEINFPSYKESENSENLLSHWSETNENKPVCCSPDNVSIANVSDLRKIRRMDKHNTIPHPNKMSHSFNESDPSKEETRNLISYAAVGKMQHDQQIIKHNLPFAALPLREKVVRVQSLNVKDIQKVDVSVQTEEIFIVSKEDWNLLNFIKSKGITEEKIWNYVETGNSEIHNSNDSPSYLNLSDTESDNENGVINIHILRKLLEQSEKNKNILNKTYNLYNKSQSNSDILEPQMKDKNNEKHNKITRMIDILISEYDQGTIHNKRHAAKDAEILHAKRRKLYNPIATPNDNNFVLGQNKNIESDIVTVPKSSPFMPQKTEPTHPQLYHYPLSWSRQSLSPYEAQNNLQLPYEYPLHNYAEIESLNRQANAVYGRKITEYPQIPQRLQYRIPRRLSPYANQQVNYFEVPRTEPNIHYGPVQQNNQYINIRGTESPHHPQTVHPMWHGESKMYTNPHKVSKSRNTCQDEAFLRESRLRQSNAQKNPWEPEITNYPNTDWSKK